MAASLLTSLAVTGALAWGQLQIGSVVVEAPGAKDQAELERVLGLRVGDALTRFAIREGVQALLATGQVEDVAVNATEGPSGVALSFKIQVASRIRSFRIVGLPTKQEREVRSLLGVRIGAPLRVASFERALEKARAALQAGGHPDATVEAVLVFAIADGVVDVQILGRLGTPRTLSRLVVEGLPAGQLDAYALTGLREGLVLGSGRVESARRAVARAVRRKGYWAAEIGAPELTNELGAATLKLRVNPGPRYRLELIGLRGGRQLVAEALPFLAGDEPFAEAALDAVVAGVRLALQRQGRLLAGVRGSIKSDGDARTLLLEIERGERTPITAVRFPGVTQVDEKLLRERIGARPGRPWRWGGEPVDEQTLESDVDSMLSTLRSAGFADAKVAPARLSWVPAGVVVEFAVEEGVRRTVGTLVVEGFPESMQQPQLSLTQGGPWSKDAEEESAERLRSALREAGFVDASVSVSRECNGATCDVVLLARPGAPTVIGQVIIAGLIGASRGVVERVAGLREGGVAGPERQLEVQRRLLGLGIFSNVSVRPVPGQETSHRQSLVVDVAEGPSRALAFGLGYDTGERTRVSVSWSELSFFGTGRSLSLDGRFSSREQRYQITYREPASLGFRGWPIWASVYHTEEDFESYDVLRRGMWIEAGDRLHRPFRHLVRYEYQVVDPRAPLDVLSRLEREKQNVKIASLTPIVEWDTRDDLFAPTRGLLASLQWQTAFKIFLAESAFDKVSASVAGFAPLWDGVLAASVRGGGIWPRDEGEVSPSDPIDVSIPVRFFAGGRVSHRAFPTDRLGIPGKTLDEHGNPKGGGALLLANLEWRFPVYGPVGANLFIDGGNVWRQVKDVTGADVRWGGGVGLRVETPIGPVRLEYGWKHKRLWLNEDKRESRGEWFLSFGNPF